MHNGKDHGFWEKAGWFLNALKEFLSRPKTRFDIKDRSIWLVFFVLLVIIVELVLRKLILR